MQRASVNYNQPLIFKFYYILLDEAYSNFCATINLKKKKKPVRPFLSNPG